MEENPERVTQLLLEASHGDQHALDAVLPIVYDELRRLARSYMRRERRERTLQTTALLHEAYRRLLGPDNTVMAAPVTTETKFDSSTPIALFQAAPRQPTSSRDQFVYDVSKDGQRFLILTQVKQAGTPPMTVVLNCSAKLNK